MTEVAAERTWFGIAPDGSECEIAIRVLVPTQAPGGEWRALVQLANLDDRDYSIAGDDAWQAMALGMRFARERVAHFSELGWRFCWERGGEAATPSDLADW
jgi:hypothetical protein